MSVVRVMGVAVLAMLMVGCGASGPWYDGANPTESRRDIGDGDDGCSVPAKITIPDSWTPRRPDTWQERGSTSAGDTGDSRYITLECQVFAGRRFAGLYVWQYIVGKDPNPRDIRKVLETYVATRKSAHDVLYRDTQVGSRSGLEVTWLGADDLRHRAFGYLPDDAAFGSLVVSVEGTPDNDFFEDALLPAYLLAKQSIAQR